MVFGGRIIIIIKWRKTMCVDFATHGIYPWHSSNGI